MELTQQEKERFVAWLESKKTLLGQRLKRPQVDYLRNHTQTKLLAMQIVQTILEVKE